jgi:endonuclease/exonuclease/phosphatase family metal-dependent hydrolase
MGGERPAAEEMDAAGPLPARARAGDDRPVTRRRAMWWRIAAILAAVVAALALSTGAPALPYRLTFLQANLCGNACNGGRFTVIAHLEDAIRERQPFAVTLNELCENQFTRLRGDLVTYRARFEPTGPTCHNGSRYGNAILVRSSQVTLVGDWLLPNPAHDETRWLTCLHVAVPRLTVCGVHVSSFLENVGPQVSAIVNVLSGLGEPGPLVLAGDFNTDIADHRLDPLRSGYTESDTQHRATFERSKFDDVFFSHGGWSTPTADVVDVAGGLSDHLGLWAAATPGG